MSFIKIIFIAAALSMDAFAVSVSGGLNVKHDKFASAVKAGLAFGSFQVIMPVLGWFLGNSFHAAVEKFDHWLAFLLLSFIGIKMIYEAFKLEKNRKPADIFKFNILIILALATSVDAFAVGFSFSLLKIAMIAPVLIIGIITFCFSFTGVLIGNKLGHFGEKKFEILGGLTLILIGLKILSEHLDIF